MLQINLNAKYGDTSNAHGSICLLIQNIGSSVTATLQFGIRHKCNCSCTAVNKLLIFVSNSWLFTDIHHFEFPDFDGDICTEYQ